jgi:hypothetical protein
MPNTATKHFLDPVQSIESLYDPQFGTQISILIISYHRLTKFYFFSIRIRS